ncbi:hypothetical protein ACF0H5_008847 [Mactra antiquata]
MSEEANGNDGTIKLQDPNEELKPRVSITRVPEIVNRLYGLKVTETKELPSYDDLNFFVRVSGKWENTNIKSVVDTGYVLKVLNSLQSVQTEYIDAQFAMCDHVRERRIPTQIPIVNKNGELRSLETFTDEDSGKQNGPYLIRLVTYVPGNIFHKTPYVPGSFYNIGKFVGKLHTALKGFHHKFYDDYSLIWSLKQLPVIHDFLHAVKDAEDVRVVKEITEAFEKHVVPKYPHFREGIIHGDVNEQNLIMTEVPDQVVSPDQRVHDVAALLDFADATHCYYVMDVAICIAYVSIESPDDLQADTGGHVLAGYFKACELNDVEFQSLKILVCARLCQSLVFGAHSFAQQPENTYLLTTSKRGWPLLHKLWKINENELISRWRDIIRDYNQ